MLLSLSFFLYVWRARKLCFNLLLVAITMLIIHPQYPHCHAPIYHLPFITTPHSMHGRHPHPSSPSLLPSPAAMAATSLGCHGTAATAHLSMVPPALGASLWRGYPGGGASWRWWCLGLAHDENWFGLKLKHPTQVDVKMMPWACPWRELIWA